MPAARKDKTICTKCGGPNDRKQPTCRSCQNEVSRKWAADNKQKRSESLKKYDGSLKGLAKSAEWRESNREHLQEWAHEYYLVNRDSRIAAACARRRRLQNEEPEILHADERERMRIWREENPEKSKEHNRTQWKRYYTEPAYRIRKRMRGQINQMFRRYLDGVHQQNARGRHWEDLLGYTCADLEARLRETVPAGYTWDDFMLGELQIDHIIPVAAFNITSYEDIDFRRCWALTNLQLLTDPKNKSKGAKLSAPFQPSLALAF